MVFLQAFLESIQLPRKKAVFRLNRIGMDITVVYMFMMLIIVSIPSFIDRLQATDGFSSDLPFVFLVIYFFIFYYLPLTIIIFLILSAVAYIGTKVAHFARRKLRFSLLWKMSAYTTTIPFLVYAILALLFRIDDTFLWLFLLYTVTLLLKIITIYPKKRKRFNG